MCPGLPSPEWVWWGHKRTSDHPRMGQRWGQRRQIPQVTVMEEVAFEIHLEGRKDVPTPWLARDAL